MVPQAEYMEMHHVETSEGAEIVPAWLGSTDVAELADYLEGDSLESEDIETRTGWYSRFSMPGYLDCTDWIGPYETERLALDGLAEMHNICGTCFKPCWDSGGGDCLWTAIRICANSNADGK